MLSAHEVGGLCDRLGLSAEARATIETIRSSPPARRVRSAAGNVAVRYPSRKMGVTIQAESHRVELAGLYEYEHDQQVVEFYDQPLATKRVDPCAVRADASKATGTGRMCCARHSTASHARRATRSTTSAQSPRQR